MVVPIRYERRYTLPFVSRSLSSETEEEMNLRKTNVQSRRHKIYDYEIPLQDLENERPFMQGRKQVPAEDLPNLPIPTPIHVREILSDEEIENVRPFMRGRVKVPQEVLKARLNAQWRLYKVLNDKEVENEAPFMHGRNEISENSPQSLVQLAPVQTTLERENERPFMHGRNRLNKGAARRQRERRLIELVDDLDNSVEKRVKRKLRKQPTERRLCPPCHALNEFRKEMLLPAVKTVHGFILGRTGSSPTKFTRNVSGSKFYTSGDDGEAHEDKDSSLLLGENLKSAKTSPVKLEKYSKNKAY